LKTPLRLVNARKTVFVKFLQTRGAFIAAFKSGNDSKKVYSAIGH
jgi:hypothetical protein